MAQLSSLHPFTLWRFRRRIGGGVANGLFRQNVLAKLGEPARRITDDGAEIWEYAVGQTRHIDFSYLVSFEGERVVSSWWRESRRDQRHLNYDSLQAWAEGDGLPKDWTKHPDQKQRNMWWQQYAELKQHLWQRHIATLTPEEQQEFKAGTHPSLSHEFRDRAQPFTEYLKEELARQGYNAEVRLGFYHLDRIVLNAVLDRTPPDRLREVPWLFRGFEVFYRFPDTEAHNAA
jgi:hypothetical protein